MACAMPDLHFIPSWRDQCFLAVTSSSHRGGQLSWSRATDVLLTKVAQGTRRPIHQVCKGRGHRKHPGQLQTAANGVKPKTHCAQDGSHTWAVGILVALSCPRAVSLHQLQAHGTGCSAWVYTEAQEMDKPCCFQQ